MVDLKAIPFCLNDEQVQWVKKTLANMTLDEKIGQLFINLTLKRSDDDLRKLCNEFHIGGARWQGGSLEAVYEQNKKFQEMSKIPLLLAANCEAGGNGAVSEGTLVATGAACAASYTVDTVRDMARIGAKEALAVGCNWTFAPVCDVLINWRNTVINTRAFGNDPKQIISLSKIYMEEMHRHGLACATKHFPGDGSEERDQHLLMGCNDLSCEEWDNTYGKVYQTLIDSGIESIMAGHICLPAYSKKLRPELKDDEIMPATMSPELLQDLLRKQMGFNGLIVTDASHMGGLFSAASRKDVIPGVIAAGCDMILFFNDPKEDIQYMKEGIERGVVTDERLEEALYRILGLKAKLGLQHKEFPAKSGLKIVGCREHHEAAQKAADASITLVKDTQGLLPMKPEDKKRIKLFYIQSPPVSLLDGTDPAKQIMVKELEEAGFEVDAAVDYYELEMKKQHPSNRGKMMEKFSFEKLKREYDAVIVVYAMKGYAQTNNTRITYSVGHSYEIPWFEHELPTLAISLNYTNHLFDVPMMKTFINAYAPTKEYIHELVQKIVGKSEFKGKYNDLVWCGRWDTRL